MIGETLGKTWKTTFKLANSIESIYTSKTYRYQELDMGFIETMRFNQDQNKLEYDDLLSLYPIP